MIRRSTRKTASVSVAALLSGIVVCKAQPLTNVTFTAFDTETTGTSRSDRVVEIAAVKFRNAEIVAKKSWLINPGIRIPPNVQVIHGITDEMVRSSPTFRQVFTEFTAFTTNTILLAHNASFDVRLINGDIRRYTIDPPATTVLDTLRLSRKWFPDTDSHSLSNMVKYLHIPSGNFHRALVDSEYVMKIFQAGIEKMPEDMTLEDLLIFCGKKLQLAGADKSVIRK